MFCEDCKIRVETGRYCPVCGKELKLEHKKLKIYKLPIIILCSIVVLLFIGFIIFPKIFRNDAKKVIDYISSGEILKGQEYYVYNIVGFSQKEEEFNRLIKDRFEDLYNEYNYDRMTYEECKSEINAYTTLTPSLVEAASDRIEQLRISKISYEKGEEFFNAQRYESAMAEYYNVIENDTNYGDAIEKFDLCYNLAVEKALADAESAANMGNYVEASFLLKSVEDFIKEEDRDHFNERERNYFNHVSTSIETLIFGEDSESIDLEYRGRNVMFDEFQDIKIESITNDNNKIIVVVNVAVSNGIIDAVIPIRLTYEKDGIWKITDKIVGEPLSFELVVYAIVENMEIGDWQGIRESTGEIRLYNKSDDTLAVIYAGNGMIAYRYHYVDGILDRKDNYLDNETEYYSYNENGKIIEKSSDRANEYWTYDNDGNLICKAEYSWKTIITNYEYDNGILIRKTTTEDGFVTEEMTYHYDINGFLVQIDVMTGNAATGNQYYKTYYYQNDANGNPLDEVAYYNDTGNLASHIAYTYHDNGNKASYTSYKVGTSKPSLVYYYDEQGNIIHTIDYSYETLGSSAVHVYEVYYEYDEQNREISMISYQDSKDITSYIYILSMRD